MLTKLDFPRYRHLISSSPSSLASSDSDTYPAKVATPA